MKSVSYLIFIKYPFPVFVLASGIRTFMYSSTEITRFRWNDANGTQPDVIWKFLRNVDQLSRGKSFVTSKFPSPLFKRPNIWFAENHHYLVHRATWHSPTSDTASRFWASSISTESPRVPCSRNWWRWSHAMMWSALLLLSIRQRLQVLGTPTSL